MGTVTVEISVTANGKKSGHSFAALEAKDARHLADHLIGHALQKVNAMMPDDPAVVQGPDSVSFEYVTTRDADGKMLGRQVNEWPIMDDATSAAIIGVYDGAMAKLDKRIAAKGHKK